MEVITFSHNWNNKLDCHAFSTIRLYNPVNYRVGAKFKIVLNGGLKPHPAQVMYEKKFYLHQLTEAMAIIDTGYSLAETKDILVKMYRDKVRAMDQQPFHFVVLKYQRHETLTTQTEIFN